MLASIRGKVSHVFAQSVIIEAGGLGYGLFVTARDRDQLQAGAEATLFIYENVREDAHDLYGFSALEAKQLFEQIIGVSGVGPKAGLAILSGYSLDEIKAAINSGDTALLTSISGIGQKTAERIIIELKNKFDAGDIALGSAGAHADTLEALISLGYSRRQAQTALAKLPPDITDDEARLRQALQQLGKG